MRRLGFSRPRSNARAGRALVVAAISVAALMLALSGAGAAAPAGSSDLKITKSDSPDPVRVGETLTYTIRVENLGPDTATGVTVTDNLPKGVDFVSATPSSGKCARKGPKVTCDLGSVATINYGVASGVTLVVIPRKPGTISNTASVNGDKKDPVASNNKATATTQVLAAVSCRGIPATIVGTAGNDILTGTGGPDVIVAFRGDDRISSFAGRDLICAGGGSDRITAGSAADRVFGGRGSDRLLGRGGPDALWGNRGNDVLKGNRGADRLRGGAGFDRCNGGPGSNSFRGCES